MAKRDILTRPSPFFHDPARSRDTFLRPMNLIGFASHEPLKHIIADPKLFNIDFALGGLYSCPW
jgi:hypothetical protein